MSIRRLVVTAAAMALVAVGLAALTPGFSAMTGSLTAAQRTVDTAGADALVVSAAGLTAWAVWGWGALGLALTAASALPGLAGAVARVALHVVLPAGARRSAALALGLGLGVAGPLLGTATALVATPASAAVPVSAVGDVPDWSVPAAHPQAAPVPDWPTAERVAGSHVVGRRLSLAHRGHAARGGTKPHPDRCRGRHSGARLVDRQRRRHGTRSRRAVPGPGAAPARAVTPTRPTTHLILGDPR